MVSNGSIGNSLLFSGPDGVGKSLFAIELAKLLICQDDPNGVHLRKIESGNHPDIKHYRPEGKLGIHTIDSMRRFNEDVYLRSYESKWKIFIIHEAHRMLPFSANALLKTFEEPASDSVIILLTCAREMLIPTILSRCRTLHFHKVEKKEITLHLIDKYHCPSDEARRYAELSLGSIGKAIFLLKNGGDDFRKKILDFMLKGRVSTYLELTDFIKEISVTIDGAKKEIESDLRAKLVHGVSDADLSAVQLQSLNKEIEGAITMQLTQSAYAIFDLILSWYRDLQLLYLGGNQEFLLNKEYEHEMQQKIIQAEPLKLEIVQKNIKEAILALQRSTPFAICLENLFLKLNFL